MSKRMSLLLAAMAIMLGAGAAAAQSENRSDHNQSNYGDGYNYGYDDGHARRDRDDRYRPGPYRRVYERGTIYYGRDCNNETAAGTILGAAAGGLIGNAAGRGNGGAVIGGVILGGLVGNTIASNMNCDDRRVAMTSYSRGFNGRVGQRHDWRRNGRSYGSFTPTREYSRDGNTCRDFREAGYSNSRSYNRTGTACRHNDGNWYTD